VNAQAFTRKFGVTLNINWQNISQQDFIDNYWQKRPVLLKNALPNLNELTDEHELAGLAMEEFVDSRIVEQFDDGQWQVNQGPFDDFSQWQDSRWSLLVQGVDRYLPKVAELLHAVDFVPQWRIDDIMVSFSMPNSGVGLHLDQYDVFIVQGKGKRRWQAGSVNHDQCQDEISDNLLQLTKPEEFTPVVDEVLECGDIIYIPPFSAHKGQTIEAAINYSIGFRAPNQQELLSYFADYLIDEDLGLQRFTGPIESNDLTEENGVPKKDVHRLRQLMLNVLQDESVFEEFCQQHFTSL
jgi:50S ribosomal protein L16 3-hydroxylase